MHSLLAAVCCASVNVEALADGAVWHVASMPHFTLVSQLSEQDTQSWAAKFQFFTTALAAIAPIDQSRLPPLTIVIFDNEAEFALYKTARPDGNAADIEGFFASQDTWAVMGFSHHDDQQMQQVMFHEGTHWYLSAAATDVPLWLEEGLAEVISMARLAPHQLLVGAPIPEHVQRLQSSNLIPLETLLTATHSDPLFNDDSRTATFYAQSWARVQKMAIHRHQLRPQILSAFLNSTQPHAREYHYNALRVSKDSIEVKSPKATSDPEPTVSDASTALVEQALAKLALGANRFAQSQQHVDKLKVGIADTAILDLQALLHWQQQDHEHALAIATQAIDAGSVNPQTFLIAANEQWRRNGQASARSVAALSGKAIQLWPTYRQAYQMLALAVKSADDTAARDIELLQQGHQLFSQDTDITVGLTMGLAKSGQTQSALLVVERLLHGDRADTDTMSQVLLAHSWILQTEYGPRIKALVARGQFDHALALANEFKKRCLDATAHQASEAMHTYVYIAQQLQAMDSALQDRDSAAIGPIAALRTRHPSPHHNQLLMTQR